METLSASFSLCEGIQGLRWFTRKMGSNAQWFETAQRAGDAPFTAQPRISKDAALKILAKQEENDSKTI